MQQVKQFSYYGDTPTVMKIVKMGRDLITLCEKNELYPKDDLMWNAAVQQVIRWSPQEQQVTHVVLKMLIVLQT